METNRDSLTGAVRGRRSGFSLLELMIMVAILLTVMGGVFTVALKSQVSFGIEVQRLTTEQVGRRILERLSREIREAAPATVLPLSVNRASQIQFQKVIGLKDKTQVLGPVMTIGFEAAPGDPLNGKDDNKDGRIDEGFIVYSVAGGPPIAVAGNVMALRFTSTPFGMSFEVDVALVDRDGLLVQKTFSEQVSYRN